MGQNYIIQNQWMPVRTGVSAAENGDRQLTTSNSNWAQRKDNKKQATSGTLKIGTRYLREAMDASLHGTEQDGRPHLRHADDVAWQMHEGSICGLGQIASLPLTSALKFFPEDFA